MVARVNNDSIKIIHLYENTNLTYFIKKLYLQLPTDKMGLIRIDNFLVTVSCIQGNIWMFFSFLLVTFADLDFDSVSSFTVAVLIKLKFDYPRWEKIFSSLSNNNVNTNKSWLSLAKEKANVAKTFIVQAFTE